VIRDRAQNLVIGMASARVARKNLKE